MASGRLRSLEALMRLALHHTSEVGMRAGRILLGERSLVELGVMGRVPRTRHRLVRPIDDLAGFDAVISDALDATEIVEKALQAGVSAVLWIDGDDIVDRYEPAFAAAERTLLVGSNLAAGLAPSLAVHESLSGDEILEVTIGWTEPGRPLRRGEALAFPEPVGGKWAVERPRRSGFRAFAAPTAGEWAGAMAQVTLATPDGVATRIVGVADLAVHLEALALSAGAITVGAFAWGAQTPAAAADRYLDTMIAAGLDVATHTMKRP